MSEFHAAVSPKLGLENAPKFGGSLSHEFVFFGNFFLHKFHKYVTLKSIFDYNMKSVIDWIPLLNKHYSGMHHIEKSVIHSQSFIHDSHRIQFLVQSNRCRVFTFMR